jgi:hypothetical protein
LKGYAQEEYAEGYEMTHGDIGVDAVKHFARYVFQVKKVSPTPRLSLYEQSCHVRAAHNGVDPCGQMSNGES